ncbi:MAG: glycine--tRNA ligase subunit beta [Alphaproteobacteria bacterium]|nr:glycine--tRNA ligase subunit beta [Alphaproteobacteria bacterium]
MSELVVELLSEEIPARMQDRARRDFERLVLESLKEADLSHGPSRAFATPRRIALVVEDLPERQPDRVEERKGPRVGAPDRAIEGFLKAAGLASLDECERREQGKAEFWFAVRSVPGRPAREVLAEIVADAVGRLAWPKSMRWGDAPMRYVRPLRNVLALFGGEPLPGGVEIGGTEERLDFSNRTEGHRFMAPAAFSVTGFADYEEKLRAAFVLIDAEERVQRIREGALEGARLSERLLAENAGLTEWPVPGVGDFDPAFLELPPEVLVTSMETHQRYFPVDDEAGGLAPRFVFVANIEAGDGNAAVRAGNERVLRARLADAKFFWDQDRTRRLEDRVAMLDAVVFHARLGSVGDKVRRLERLADRLAEFVPGADSVRCRQAVGLAKADLVTGMVGEFPELQGLMGRYYALGEGLDPEVADALAEHYSPQGPSDEAPMAPVSIVAALADKFDTLAGFFSIDERPTGSRDPFALRRAALGIVRIVLENALRLPLREAIASALEGYGTEEGGEALFAFFEDRLKAHLRERGARHDLVSAVFALGNEDDLTRLMARVSFLERFVDEEDGANLLTAYKRAGSILAIEEKKDSASYGAEADPAAFAVDAERALHEALVRTSAAASRAVEAEDFSAATQALATLRAPVDRFFDEVTVNADDAALRVNRLRLLAGIRAATAGVADFSRIEG